LSLSILSLIYSSIVSFLGASWLAWVALMIFTLVVLSTILKVPYMIVLALSALPFLLLAIYAVIQVSNWLMFLVMVLLGVVLAISIYKLFTR
jgi:hypothetical protein